MRVVKPVVIIVDAHLMLLESVDLAVANRLRKGLILKVTTHKVSDRSDSRVTSKL